MSKQRALARAAREAEATARAAELAEQRKREAATRARREARSNLWRRVRLWQRRPTSRNTEKTRVLITAALVLLGLAYVFTRSVQVVIGVALIMVISSPVVIKLTFDRSK